MIDISAVKVMYEDNHLIAVNKPAGWLVQGDRTGDLPLIEAVKEYVRIRYKKPGAVFLGLIHRLDRPVSGTVVFARTSKALTRMNKLFQERKVDKEYWAVVMNRPEPISGKLVNYIWKDRAKNRSKILEGVSKKHPDAKAADLQYELIGELDGHHLLRVLPRTGRPHQIRVQLAHIGCPIKGDKKYGSKRDHADGGIYLHCRKLRFEHPVKKEMIEIVADPPEEETWNLMMSMYLQ